MSKIGIGSTGSRPGFAETERAPTTHREVKPSPLEAALDELLAALDEERDRGGLRLSIERRRLADAIAGARSIRPRARVHRLKTDPEQFSKVVDGTKPFEVRKNDRGFAVGDVLELLEFDRERSRYSGRAFRVDVTSMVEGQYGLAADLVVMGIRPAFAEAVAGDLARRLLLRERRGF